MKKKLLIIGAGGHGRVVADIASRTGRYKCIAFVDNNITENVLCLTMTNDLVRRMA